MVSSILRMLLVRADGSKKHYDLMEHTGTYEDLKNRIDKRVQSTKSSQYYKKVSAHVADESHEPDNVNASTEDNLVWREGSLQDA